MLIVALYRRSLLSCIHHAYQVRVLLAVETQAESGCSVPNRTVPYCTVLTRTARWKRAITDHMIGSKGSVGTMSKMVDFK